MADTRKPTLVVFKRRLADGDCLFERQGTYFRLSPDEVQALPQLIEGKEV